MRRRFAPEEIREAAKRRVMHRRIPKRRIVNKAEFDVWDRAADRLIVDRSVTLSEMSRHRLFVPPID
jgi:hypothetical protein